MANFLVIILFMKHNKNVIKRMPVKVYVVFLVPEIMYSQLTLSRSRTANSPYILPSPSGPRVSAPSSESPDQLPLGFVSQLVERCTGIVEARVPVLY